MSEFSESFHLKTDNVQKGIELLRRTEFQGVVFKPTGKWVTIIPKASLHEAVDAFVEANHGTLLHYMYAEDHGWMLTFYQEKRKMFYYECFWESGFHINSKDADMDVLKQLLDNSSDFLQLKEILYPMPRHYADNHHEFAQLIGLKYYEWLSGEYIENIDNSYSEIAYSNIIKVSLRQELLALIHSLSFELKQAIERNDKIIEGVLSLKYFRDLFEIMRIAGEEIRSDISKRHYQRAFELIDEILKLLEYFPNTPAYIVFRATLWEYQTQIFMLQDREEEAKPIVEQLLKLDEAVLQKSDLHLIFLKLGTLYADKKRDELAGKLYDKVLVCNKYFPCVENELKQISDFYQEINEPEKAEMVENILCEAG